MRLVGGGLLLLGAIRLYLALRGSFVVPMAGGFQATAELEPPTDNSKLLTTGLVGAGLYLVLKK